MEPSEHAQLALGHLILAMSQDHELNTPRYTDAIREVSELFAALQRAERPAKEVQS